ncbi:zinc finger protein 493-like isoform X1 [Scophthalmus maximus]|uniref:zinc finger protein 493-like isoform X1 n=1 Tax=Scophthalmus maximus TaxID=52904 RepID=UPI001FA9111F|nr:zinc finger protein 493-like isoform X1 [Scophthalmus maximus]
MSKTLTDRGSLPLSSLRLIVPPLQLLSAALWQVVKQGAVMYYGLLEEFVSSVLDTVPGLLAHAERVQLVVGLRARVVLECGRSEGFASPQAVQHHLSRMNAYITKQEETSSSEVKASVTNFLKLVHTLVDDHCQRDIFYQKIFPTVFGPKYDSALEALMRKFLFNLQKLLPVPNLEQTSLWLSLSPSVLKECVDFMKHPELLNTLIQHHKHHGHEVPQALSSSGDDCILSSLSYHLPKVNNDEGDKFVISGSVCIGDDWHTDNSIGSESAKDEEENFEEIKPEVARNVQRNGQQHTDDVTEYEGASVEVTLEPFDESESNDDDGDGVLDKKWLPHLKAHNRTSSRTFKCLACGRDFGSISKLKRHKVTQCSCLMNRRVQSDSSSQSRFFTKIKLHPKPKIIAQRSEAELPLAGLSAHNPSDTRSLSNFEANDDSSLVCRSCGKVFTYPKNFDKHQRICAVSSKRQMQTNPQCSTASAHHSQSNPVDKTKVALLSESNTEPSGDAPLETLSSDSGKRSSRVKKCSVCGQIFTCSADSTRHMRSHIDTSQNFDSYNDCETHEGQCRVSNQGPKEKDEFMLENSSRNSTKRNLEDTLVSVADTPANTRSVRDCKSPLTCKECGKGFSYYKNFEKHQSKCYMTRPGRKMRTTNTNHFVINGCFQSADNTDESCAETSSDTNERKPETRPSPTGDSQTESCNIKCTMCEKNFSEIVPLRRHYAKSHKVRGSYPCQSCRRTFVRLCELVRHQQNKKLYQCSTCKKCYTKPGLLDDHQKVHAASVTASICETCGKIFKSLTYLILHQSKHREKQPSVCSYCGKQFSTKDCLKAHMVRHTGGYPCPVCGKKFNQKTYLKWHLYKHTGQEPYLCDTCGKGWPSAAQLRVHMVQHTEERPFKCQDCGVCYKRRSHLMAHRSEKHIRLRPFVCEICSKAFRLNNVLKKHMMVHTGERPFTCPKCGKTFTRNTRLREHKEKTCL